MNISCQKVGCPRGIMYCYECDYCDWKKIKKNHENKEI